MDVCIQDKVNNVSGALLNMDEGLVGQNELYTFVTSEVELFGAFVNVVRRLVFSVFPLATSEIALFH